MSCKCDPSWNDGGECRCNDSPPLPAGSPQRALNFSICPRSERTRINDSFKLPKINIPENCRETNEGQAITGLDSGCVSLEYRRRAPCSKPLSPRIKKPRCPAREPEVPPRPPPCRADEAAPEKKRKKLVRSGRNNSHESVECAIGPDVTIPCGVTIAEYERNLQFNENEKNRALEQNMSNTDWHVNNCCPSTSRTEIHQTDSPGKPCSSDKRRNMLKSKLRELLREIEPIPESCLLESVESKPEPEILAEVLLMSEAEGIDLGDIKPDNIFDNLFSEMTLDRSIAISSAGPESMSDVVVPVQISGHEVPSFDLANSERIIENVRGRAAPNLNAFKQSNVYEKFSEHMNELLERTPSTHNISELLGARIIGNGTDNGGRNEDGILDYVMKPGPPSHVNRIRLNGSMRPNWFPGYTILSPFIPGYTRVTNDPGEALKEAWRLCRPRQFDDESISLVNIG